MNIYMIEQLKQEKKNSHNSENTCDMKMKLINR